MTPEEAHTYRDSLLREFYGNRRLAHEVIFKHRHPIRTPGFHHVIQDAFHGPRPQVVIEGFRDAAKSTVAEEAFVLGALFKEFRFGVVLGASLQRAKERLMAIANEFVVNDAILQLFGHMQGETWGAEKIVLTNGVCIMAAGAGQSMRGLRYLDDRPDFVLIDDLEDEESVRTPEARDQMMQWLGRTLLPALKKGAVGTIGYRVRFMGNRLDADAVIVRISKDPAWHHLKFPIMVQHEAGEERYDLPEGRWLPQWPDKFSLEEIAAKRQEYQRLGLMQAFNCEYMCEAEDPATKLFKAGDARTLGRVRTWEAVYAAYDPARTVKGTSATTGIAVFSWVGTKLVVWRGDAQLWLPDQIVDDILKTDEEWGPVEIGVEATGLEEFIRQPLRHRALQRNQLLPLRDLTPPKGKDTFIRGLQPFFRSGEVEFVDVSDEARTQLLSFPSGRKDFPNALAYALMMRPGLPIYEVGRDHMVEELIRVPNQPWYLVMNATAKFTTAALIQVIDGQVRVHADWVREGPPAGNVSDIVRSARTDAGAAVRVVTPSLRFSVGDTVGLNLALRAVQSGEIRSGGDGGRGRLAIGDLLNKRRRDQPLFLCCHAARWVLNAMAGGYAFAAGRKGALSREPVENAYRVLMEGIESFCAHLGGVDRPDEVPRQAMGVDGRPYITTRTSGLIAGPTPSKDQWDVELGHGIVNSIKNIRINNGRQG